MPRILNKILFLCVLFLLAISLCPAQARAGEKRLTIAAASDLSFALKDISREFEKDTGYSVVLSFGSTGMLAKQIEEGAPFDVLFAADIAYVDGLAKKGAVIPDSVELYAQGRIVLAKKKGPGPDLKELKDLKKNEVSRIAIANPDHAPYGKAAVEAFKSAGVWDAVKGKLVYGENIRQALQFVQSGNAQAGIIALSVANLPDIEYAEIPASLHRPINQAAGVVRLTREERGARAFVKYVNGPKGRPIMEKYGFTLPR